MQALKTQHAQVAPSNNLTAIWQMAVGSTLERPS